MTDGVEKLLERVEPAYERQRNHVHHHIRAHQRYQFGGLPHPLYVEEYGKQHGEQDAGGCRGCIETVADHGTHLPGVAPSEESSDDRRQSVAEAQCEDKYDGHYGVDEACGGKFVHAVVAHHQRVGEAQYDSAHLAHDERQSERK